jgi:hypothetical protein
MALRLGGVASCNRVRAISEQIDTVTAELFPQARILSKTKSLSPRKALKAR